ncbi:MAG TPA: SH3 domain-containing protein [Gemmataceae bacterium]|nr:SH3 domain-containing protein [Gemmataceae bacterium]
MRSVIFSGITFIGLFAAAAQAQPVLPGAPKAERILVPDVDVRSGPSPQFPAVGKLKQGDIVEVKGDAANSPGWLEIVPPPGTISWISDDAVEAAPPNPNGKRIFKVKKDKTPIRTGTILGQPPVDPPIERCEVPAGTPVTVLGEKVSLPHNENLWPIEPVANDSRYIPNSAIKPPPPPTTVNATPAANTRPAAAAGSNDPPLWTQADQALKEGRLDDASRLLLQLCAQARTSNDELLSDRCRTRLFEIKQMRRTGTLTSRSGSTGFTPPDLNSPPPPPLGKPTSISRNAPVKAVAPKKDNEESAAGYLRRSGLEIEKGKPTYALENKDGSLRLYVTTDSVLDLEPYVNRIIELQGVIKSRSDVRGGNHMVASKATLLK